VVYDGASASLTPGLLRELYGADADEILALPARQPAGGERGPAREEAQDERLAAQAG
jgi:phosphonate transport system ATP-binding protein